MLYLFFKPYAFHINCQYYKDEQVLVLLQAPGGSNLLNHKRIHQVPLLEKTIFPSTTSISVCELGSTFPSSIAMDN